MEVKEKKVSKRDVSEVLNQDLIPASRDSSAASRAMLKAPQQMISGQCQANQIETFSGIISSHVYHTSCQMPSHSWKHSDFCRRWHLAQRVQKAGHDSESALQIL